MRIVFQCLWLCLYLYVVYQNGRIEKGWIKFCVLNVITGAMLVVGLITKLLAAAWLLVIGVMVLYVLFYDKEPFIYQWWKIVLTGLMPAMGELLVAISMDEYIRYNITYLLLLFILLLLGRKRKYLTLQNACIIIAFYIFLNFIHRLLQIYGKSMFTKPCYQDYAGYVILTASLLVFILLEEALSQYQRGYESNKTKFQQEVLEHQYTEIEAIYKDMRGWRHDYHNHLQVLKAQIMLKKWPEVWQYLNELEQELDRIDMFVKSGNLMVDAIINSKLSLAEKLGTKIHCKVEVPESLPITDVDLCVIIGNLLDNAMESCEKIEPEERFIRVYIVINKMQLYLSIQNSAKEELDFNEKNYITSKRGNHGLGMLRVKTLIDKYGGYLNLQNEPGIFAAEATIPVSN